MCTWIVRPNRGDSPSGPCVVSPYVRKHNAGWLFPMPSEAFRQGNRKRRTFSLFAFDGNRALMFVDDPLDDGQP